MPQPKAVSSSLDAASSAEQLRAIDVPQIPDYALLRRIGRGSYGDVWLAQNVLGEYRAIKIVRCGGDKDRLYEREIGGIRRFEPISRSHPGYVAILHVGTGERFFYYAMELADDAGRLAPATELAPAQPHRSPLPARSMEGYSPRTLSSHLRRDGPFSVAECIRIGTALTRDTRFSGVAARPSGA